MFGEEIRRKRELVFIYSLSLWCRDSGIGYLDEFMFSSTMDANFVFLLFFLPVSYCVWLLEH